MPLDEVSSSLDRLVLIEVVSGLVLLGLLGTGSWFILRRGLRPLEQMADSARSITVDTSRRAARSATRCSRTDDARPTTGREVGQLGLAINTMLAEIEEAFRERDATEQRLRQFLSDASHELRTPLTSIQGFAELFRLGARGRPRAARGDLPAHRGGVGADEDARRGPAAAGPTRRDPAGGAPPGGPRRARRRRVQRRGGDQPRPADHAGRARAGGGARATATTCARRSRTSWPTRCVTPRRHARSRWAPGSSTARPRCTVRDHGAGLDPDAIDHVFDRFWQADRARVGAGTGLGLSIVAGIAEEHRGSVSASNVEGGGASFTLRLPLDPVAVTQSRSEVDEARRVSRSAATETIQDQSRCNANQSSVRDQPSAADSGW